MKKIFIFLLAFTLLNNAIKAVTAYPYPVEVTQPDGQKITILLKGDEKVKWAISDDGYTLLRNREGAFCYAYLNENGDLVPSELIAHNTTNRGVSEKAFLQTVEKGLSYSRDQVSMLKSIWDIQKKEGRKSFPTTGDRNLVCILMGFTDKAFTKTQNDFNNLFNQVGYTLDGATGSVKDFYKESSYNQLNLTVTVAGPYTAANNMAYYGANDADGYDVKPDVLVTEAVTKADADVNFANFDNDGDGHVDGIYVIYAGYGEEAGAPANTIWAHAWEITPVTKDGKIISTYSCSSELRGTTGSNITRIGVICHEFGHVLGAPDFYDTNYETNNEYDGTGDWDLQAGGSWNNNGATPAPPNAYTKIYIYNWATATTLSSAANLTINNSNQNAGSFYRYNTNTANEFFLLENKQQIGFDSHVPGHGLLIYHVDENYINNHSSANDINATNHQGLYPMSATSTTGNGVMTYSSSTTSTAGCPWPGTGNKTQFTDATTPNAKSWAGVNTAKPITTIAESGGVITLKFMGGEVLNPASLTTGQISVNQINLSWTPNASNNNVLLVYNTTNTFGTPVNGTTYTAGQTVTGGGTVLQYGSATSYLHQSLAAGATYYYKIFSYNGTGYSTGVSTSATTLSNSIPAGYYDAAAGLCEANLKTALYNIIKGHTVISYDGLWTSFQTTDKKANGKVWDMYSNVEFTFGTDQCGNYSAEGDCYNREHSWPKSWFNDASPMYSDLFHLVPTDGYVNNRRGNYPFGEVASPTYTSGNGSKLGTCSYPGYTGIVFEPVDEYKGDFARSYFYMATRYENVIANWESNSTEANAVLDGTSYPCFETWIKNMLIEWSNQDPVSQKEIDRNQAVYAIQHNRNPYIDHPEYVDKIWGSGCSASNPTVNISVSSNAGSEASASVITVTVTASAAVSGNQTVNLTVSGTGITTGDYTLGNSVITIASGTTQGTTTFTVVNDANVEGTETAILTISSPSGGIALGATVSQNIVITDDESGGGSGGSDCASDLIISEYVEGSSNNKYIELYNGTSASINLSDYQLLLFSNGSTSASQTVTLSGTLASKATIVYKNSSAAVYTGDATTNAAVGYNGDDAVALKKISTASYIDIFGRIGEDPGTAWISGSVTTLDKTLVRKETVYSGVTANPASGFPTLESEWNMYDIDVVSNLGSHTMTCGTSIPTVELSVSTNTAEEADATVVTVTATASSAVSGNQTVNLAVSGTGITASDYTLSNTTITIADGATTGSVTFTIVDDSEVEGAETAILSISNPSAGLVLGNVSIQNITIADNDVSANPVVNLSVSTNSATEANATVVTVTATASSAVTGNQTVSLAVSGTGITATDYSLSNSTITIAGGTTSGNVTFTVLDDADVEGAETAILTISSPSTGISLGSTTTQNIAITDNDVSANPTVTLSVNTNSASEADATIVTVTATASSAVTGNQTVSLAVSGTGITATDYSLSNSTITIAGGATTGSVIFTILDDSDVEGTETAVLAISNPSAGITFGSTTSQNITITDNDVSANPTVNLSLSTNLVSEGNGTVVVVTATASSSVSGNQTVSLTVSGTGITAGDYSLSNATITIADGTNAGSVNFTVTDDSEAESAETAILTISNPSTGISLGSTTSQNITIIDNDGTADSYIKITSISDLADGDYVIVNSGDEMAMNSSNAGSYFTNTAVTPSSGTISNPAAALVWHIQSHADGGYSIYNAATSKYVSYTGSSNAAYAVDAITGANERWNITYASDLFSITNIALNTRILQYNSSSPRFACYTSAQQKLLLYKKSSSVNQAVIAVSTSSLQGFTYNLGAGPSISQSFNVSEVNLSPASGSLTINGSTDFEVSLSANSGYAPSVNIAYTGGLLNALPVYVRLKAGLPAAGYNNETLTISGGGASAVNVTCSGTVSATSTQQVNLSVSSNTASEAEGTVITVTATASSAVLGDQTLSLSVTGTGITNSDYILSNGTMTITDGSTLGSVNFTVVNDLTVEDTETAILTISNFSDGILPGSTVSQNVTITDNDTYPEVNLSVSTNSGSEANKTVVTVTVTALAPVAGNQTVNLAVSGTSITSNDYTLASNNITINDGATTGSTTFTITDDSEVELEETATLTISNPSSGILMGSTPSQNIVITDNDMPTGGCTTGLIISEYGEGTNYNKYIEIYNGTGAMVTLTGNYRIGMITNGGNWSEASIPLTGTINNNDVFIIANNSANASILAAADQTSGSLTFNGDDAVALQTTAGANIDVIGLDGVDPGTGWNVAGTANATADHVLVRKATVYMPQTSWSASAGTNNTNSEWAVYPADDFTYIGTHHIDCDGMAQTVELSVDSHSGSEADQTVITITASTSAPVTGEQTVPISVSGTNITADDYILSNTVIVIADGETSGIATLTVADDTEIEEDETATISISNPSAGLTLGSMISQNILISSDDALCVAPTVETGLVIIDINSTSALANGKIIAEGLQVVSASGFCWGTTIDPDLTGSFINYTGTETQFTETIAGLTIDQAYYIRAFATNECGTSYGNSRRFIAGNRTSDLIISEYIEGTDNNKFIELYNGTNHAIDLSHYQLGIYRDGGPAVEAYLSLGSATLASNGIFIISNQSQAIFENPVNLTTGSSVMTFNGNDPVGLFKDNGTKALVLSDVVGTVGSPGVFAELAGLRRNLGVTIPSSTFNLNEWTLISEADIIDGLGFPLPVTLSSFAGVVEAPSVKLTWETAAELNSSFFELQQSADGLNFSAVGRLEAAGNSSTLKQYQVTDDHPFIPLTYYQLKMVDLDGTIAYSNKIVVDTRLLTINDPKVYFNGEHIILEKMPEGFRKAEIKLFDVSGRQLMNIHLEEQKGQYTYQMPANLSRPGIYLLQLEYKSNIKAVKIVY